MQPQQVNSSDPYGFIMNSPGKPPHAPLDKRARIAIVAGGALLLVIAAVVVMSILSSGDKAQTQRYIEIAQKQTEIIRVSALADKKAKSITTRSYAITTRLGMESSQRNTNAMLAKRGINEKKLAKLLPAGKNTKTDTTLEEASKNNRFDETFMTLIDNELVNYQKLLNDAAGGASKNDKNTLQKAFSQVATLKKKPTSQTTPTSTEDESTDNVDTTDDSSVDNSSDSGDSVIDDGTTTIE